MSSIELDVIRTIEVPLFGCLSIPHFRSELRNCFNEHADTDPLILYNSKEAETSYRGLWQMLSDNEQLVCGRWFLAFLNNFLFQSEEGSIGLLEEAEAKTVNQKWMDQ